MKTGLQSLYIGHGIRVLPLTSGRENIENEIYAFLHEMYFFTS